MNNDPNNKTPFFDLSKNKLYMKRCNKMNKYVYKISLYFPKINKENIKLIYISYINANNKSININNLNLSKNDIDYIKYIIGDTNLFDYIKNIILKN